jgi:hypothetical protein
MLYYGIKSVEPQNDYKLLLTLDDDRRGIFDMKPYLEKGIFKQLKNIEMFNTVRPFAGNSFAWANNADISPESIFEKTTIIQDRS